MSSNRYAGKATPVFIVNSEDGQQSEIIANLPGYTENNGYPTIEVTHKNVHRGIVFVAESYVASVANNGNHDVRFRTGPDYVHFTMLVTVGGNCLLNIWEGATISAGTPISAINQNRNSANISNSTAYDAPTVTATGSVKIVNNRLVAGGATAQTRVGGSIRAGTEIVLKPNTEYLFRITNVSGAAVSTWLGIEYYNNNDLS